jgi:hypothetical protein
LPKHADKLNGSVLRQDYAMRNAQHPNSVCNEHSDPEQDERQRRTVMISEVESEAKEGDGRADEHDCHSNKHHLQASREIQPIDP